MIAFLREENMYGIPFAAYKFWASDTCQAVTSVVGTIFVLYLIARAAVVVLTVTRPSNLQIYCHSESGSWALVTGASDGIGRAFSDELLSRGFNVLLHGRNPNKLKRLKEELLNKYPKRSVDIVVADASGQNDNYRIVSKNVEQLPGKLTILVNNVGGVTTRPQYLPHAEVPHEDIDIQLNTNIRFTTHLTKELLPVLQQNGPSLILNCGSSGGTMGIPYIVTYSSCKAYIHAFSSSLKTELAAEGIDNVEVMGLIIGNVTSASNAHTMAFTISSQECAAACLDKTGSGSALVYSHWKHALQAWPLQFLSERRIRDMVAVQMRKRRDAESKGM